MSDLAPTHRIGDSFVRILSGAIEAFRIDYVDARLSVRIPYCSFVITYKYRKTTIVKIVLFELFML